MATVTDADLLEAALEQFALVGVRRSSGDDIARRAGVNRATLYRRLGTMEEIVAAAMVHEAGTVLAAIDAEVGTVPEVGSGVAFDPAEHVVRYFGAAIRELRGNRLLRQALLVDREQALVGLTLGAGGVLELAAGLGRERIRALRAWQRPGEPEGGADTDVEAAAITVARIAQSLVVTPDAAPRLDTPEALRAYAEAVIVPMMLR